jgi:hypothetical protein
VMFTEIDLLAAYVAPLSWRLSNTLTAVAERHVETAAVAHLRRREAPMEEMEALTQILDQCRTLAVVAAAVLQRFPLAA